MAEHTPRTVFQSHAPLAQIDHIFIQRCGKPITAAKTKNAALRLLRHWVNSTWGGVLTDSEKPWFDREFLPVDF